MKENNEVVQGADSNGAVLSAEKDIKKINACIALMVLKDFYDSGLFPEKHNSRLVELSERLSKTSLYISPENIDEDEALEQTFNLIEEYLKEQGV